MNAFFKKICAQYQRSMTFSAYGCITILALIFVGSLWLGFWQSFAVITMSVLVLFLPGFFISFIFFPEHIAFMAASNDQKLRRALDPLERVTLAILLSIVITSGLIYILYTIQLNISDKNVLTPFYFILFAASINILLCIIVFLMHQYVMRKKKI